MERPPSWPSDFLVRAFKAYTDGGELKFHSKLDHALRLAIRRCARSLQLARAVRRPTPSILLARLGRSLLFAEGEKPVALSSSSNVNAAVRTSSHACRACRRLTGPTPSSSVVHVGLKHLLTYRLSGL